MAIELERMGWTNNSQPAINGANLKKMEDNTEKAINSIYEVVENENGTAIKYENGIMICTGEKTFPNINFNSDYYGFCKRSSTENMYATFLVAFIEKQICVISANADGRWIVENSECTETITQKITMLSPNSKTDVANVVLKYHAIGKWK